MNLFELPYEIITQIFDFCTYGVLHRVSQTSKLMYKIYIKYIKPFENKKIPELRLGINEIILHLKKLQTVMYRIKVLENKKKWDDGIKFQFCNDRYMFQCLIDIINLYIIIHYSFIIVCDRCDSTISIKELTGCTLYNDKNVYFCEKCIFYVCEKCITHEDLQDPKCEICFNTLLLRYYLD